MLLQHRRGSCPSDLLHPWVPAASRVWMRRWVDLKPVVDLKPAAVLASGALLPSDAFTAGPEAGNWDISHDASHGGRGKVATGVPEPEQAPGLAPPGLENGTSERHPAVPCEPADLDPQTRPAEAQASGPWAGQPFRAWQQPCKCR